MKKIADAPIPYFGNKKYISDTVWRLFGDVRYYIEPFAGIIGCLLYRPAEHEKWCETINDLNGYLVNMWRAIKYKPDETAHYSFDMLSEQDYHAKWYYLRHYDTTEFCQRLEREPEFCDPKLAGWYIEVMCSAIGSDGLGVNAAFSGFASNKPVVNKALPFIAYAGMGVYADLPKIETALGIPYKEAQIRHWFNNLANRLARVRVCYGDWRRVLTNQLVSLSKSAILFDPPYDKAKTNYGNAGDIADDVREWCEVKYKPNIKLILCGHGAEHDELLNFGWNKCSWKARKGLKPASSKGVDKRDEQMWLSPNIDITVLHKA